MAMRNPTEMGWAIEDLAAKLGTRMSEEIIKRG